MTQESREMKRERTRSDILVLSSVGTDRGKRSKVFTVKELTKKDRKRNWKSQTFLSQPDNPTPFRSSLRTT